MIKLTIRQMLYFQALAQTLHFGKAARIAGVTQPALSSQIADMEGKLNCQLFDRSGKAVRLTEKARTLLPRIERILIEIRDLEADALRGKQTLEGRFRLGIIPTVAPYLLPHALPELKQRFPHLLLELKEAITSSLIEDATKGHLDAFVAAMPIATDGLEMLTLFDDRFFLAVPAGDPHFLSPPVPPTSPELERLMLLEEGHCMREQALSICGSLKPTALENYGATSLTTLLQMVSHGLGLTLIPEMALPASHQMAGLRVVPFTKPVPTRQICLAWRRKSARTVECIELAATLRELRERLLPSGPLAPAQVASGERNPANRQTAFG